MGQSHHRPFPMNKIKRFIVAVLEHACRAANHPAGCLLARWSDKLDQRWETRWWTPVTK